MINFEETQTQEPTISPNEPNLFECILTMFTKGFINSNCEDDPILKCIELEASLHNPNPYIPLVFSSCFLFASGIVAFTYGLCAYFILSFVTTTISINHWRDVRRGPRRTADLIGAKISFVLFFVSGCFAIHITILQWVAIPLCAVMIVLYYFSNILREQRNPHWMVIHFVFHMCVAFEQVLVVLWIAENMKTRNSYWMDYNRVHPMTCKTPT
jgi:hypothetical protein